MITYEQLEEGLERVEKYELFVLSHPGLGRIVLSRDGEFTQVDLGDHGASIWCQHVDLSLDALSFWVEAEIIGMIDAKDLEVYEHV